MATAPAWRALAADEARKSTQGRHMIRERVMAMGKDSIYNLTGLVRTFPLQPQDLEPLENQFTDNQLIARERAVGSQTGPVVWRGRLGGLLSYYHREVA